MAVKQNRATVFGCFVMMTFGMVSLGGRASAAALTFDNQGNHPGGTFTWDSTSARLSNGVIDRVSDGTTALVTGSCAGGVDVLVSRRDRAWQFSKVQHRNFPFTVTVDF